MYKLIDVTLCLPPPDNPFVSPKLAGALNLFFISFLFMLLLNTGAAASLPDIESQLLMRRLARPEAANDSIARQLIKLQTALNNQNNAFGYTVDLQNPAIIDAIIGQNADACIFYYTNSCFRFNALNAEAYNFSNTYATLYPNLIQLLRIRYESKPELRLRA